MYKYTATKTNVRTISNKKYRDPDYSKCAALLQCYRVFSYAEIVAFRSEYPGVVFYSETPRDTVPLQGFLFPAALFNEEKV